MKKLVSLAIVLAFVVIVLGAYARLTDAGLGCPDWPGCYGHLSFNETTENIETAQQAFPDRPFEEYKAWNEMIHRYFAGSLGFLILIIFLASVFKKDHLHPKKLPFFLVLLVGFQGALGMWTVTLNLMPVIVMGHLLGGFSVLSCLFLLRLRLTPYRIPGGDSQMRSYAKFALLGLGILVAQIALGGWTSANYAALACTELPFCEGDWIQQLDFAGAFSVPDAENYEFGAHDYPERMTMHMMHRIGALITFVYLAWLSMRLYTQASSRLIKRQSIGLISMLGVQVILGVSNIVYSLPISVAVAHNAVAACLLLILIKVNYTLYRKV